MNDQINVDLRRAIEEHIRMDAPAPDLAGFAPGELLDALVIASEEWAKAADLLEIKFHLKNVVRDSADESAARNRYRARLARASALRHRVRDRLVDLLNPVPR